MAIAIGQIAAMKRAAARSGAAATFVTRVALYGTRRFPATNAGTAPNRTPVIGIGKHSVWQGTKQLNSGAPIVRRNRPA
jgi:hypothetical protein